MLGFLGEGEVYFYLILPEPFLFWALYEQVSDTNKATLCLQHIHDYFCVNDLCTTSLVCHSTTSFLPPFLKPKLKLGILQYLKCQADLKGESGFAHRDSKGQPGGDHATLLKGGTHLPIISNSSNAIQ